MRNSEFQFTDMVHVMKAKDLTFDILGLHILLSNRTVLTCVAEEKHIFEKNDLIGNRCILST